MKSRSLTNSIMNPDMKSAAVHGRHGFGGRLRRKVTMKSIFDNLINGNTDDAKTGAKRQSFQNLYSFARDEMGWSVERSEAACQYLKRNGSFQSYCDAK